MAQPTSAVASSAGVVFRTPTIIDSIMGNMGAPVDDGLFHGNDDVARGENENDVRNGSPGFSGENHVPSSQSKSEEIFEARTVVRRIDVFLLMSWSGLLVCLGLARTVGLIVKWPGRSWSRC